MVPMTDERLSEIKKLAANLTYAPTKAVAGELLDEIDRLREVVREVDRVATVCRYEIQKRLADDTYKRATKTLDHIVRICNP